MTWEEQEEVPRPWIQGPDSRGGGELGVQAVLGVDWCLPGLWGCAERRLTCVHQRLGTQLLERGPGQPLTPDIDS